MARLDDKVALVIGGASGIGLAIAQRFAAEGAEVYFTGRRQSDLDAAHARVGHRSHAVLADAGRLEDVKAVVDQIGSDSGRIDVLVVNAGFTEPSSIESITEDHFDRLVGVNLRALLFAVQVGAAPDESRCDGGSRRLDRRQYRHRGVQRLRRGKGRRAGVGAHVDHANWRRGVSGSMS